MNDELERTQLYDWHEKHGDVVPFAGWLMPVRYTSIIEEHLITRTGIGLYDTSHMKRYWIEGPDCIDFLQTVTTNNVRNLEINGGQYSTCLNENGGIFDDLMLYRIEAEKFIWVTNAANGPKIWAHLQEQAKKFNVKLIDKSKEIAMIAVQGPKAMYLFTKMLGHDADEYGRFTAHQVKMAGYDTILCRTGYTGEDGGEVLVLDTPFTDEGTQRAISFWEELLKQGDEFGIKPCGLGARDSTRLEAGFVLYGHELDEETSPIEARIAYAVKFKVEPHYLGYDVVTSHKKEGTIRKTRIGLTMIDRGIPREHYPIVFNGDAIGETTSGGMSPISKKGIALAYVKPGVVKVGDIVEVDIKGRLRQAEVVTWPFYDPEKYGSTRTC